MELVGLINSNAFAVMAAGVVGALIVIGSIYFSLKRKRIKKPEVKEEAEIEKAPIYANQGNLNDFILYILSDGKPHTKENLIQLAEKAGINIKGKSYKAAVHRTLFGMKAKKLIENNDAGWLATARGIAKTPFEEASADKTELCLIVDANSRSFGTEEISLYDLQKVKEANDNGIGRQWNYEGKDVYYLFRNKDMVLSPIMMPVTLETPPSLLYEALSQEDTEIIFDVRKDEGKFAKYGPYLIVAGIAAFVIVATMQKGG